MRLSLVALSLVCITLSAHQAQAEERWPRWYIGISSGVSYLDESDLSGSISGDLNYNDGGFIITGALGYMPFFGEPWLDNLRFEIEGGYHYGSLDSFTSGGTLMAASKHVNIISYMANVFYDIDTDTKWTPYLGAGVGGATIELAKNSGLGNRDTQDTVLAYQFLTGVSYAPESIPLTEWGLGYRYFNAMSSEFGTAGTNLELGDISSHSVEANAKFRF